MSVPLATRSESVAIGRRRMPFARSKVERFAWRACAKYLLPQGIHGVYYFCEFPAKTASLRGPQLHQSNSRSDLCEDVLDLFGNLIHVSASCFYLVSQDARAFGHVLRGLSYDNVPSYNNIYCKLDPCHPSRYANSKARVITLQNIVPQVRLERSAYYREFMMPLRMHHKVQIFFRHKGAIIAGISLVRTREERAFTLEDLRIIEGASTFIESLIEHRFFLLTDQTACDPAADFTKREQDVTALVKLGFSNQKIAETLGLRLPTVKSHLQNIFTKIGVGSRTALISRLAYGEQFRP